MATTIHGDEEKIEIDANQSPLPFNLTDLDREVLSQTDEEYVPHGWEELKGIIGMYGLI